MYWKSTLCPMTRAHYPGCALPKSCTGKGCDVAACSACIQKNRFGFRYDDGSDGDVMQAVNASAASGELQAVVYHGWTASRHHVANISSGPGHVVWLENGADRPIGYWTGLQSEGGQRYYLENSEALLDSPGEWYIKPSRMTGSNDDGSGGGGGGGGGELLYYPLPGEVASNIAATVPLLTNMISFENAVGLTVEDVEVDFSDWSCGGASRTAVCDAQSVCSTVSLPFFGVRVVGFGHQPSH
jgi:hypothetical protein